MAKKLQLSGTEEEMRQVAGKICRNYLNGAWKTVDPADIEFRRISGGLSNFLYLVGLPDNQCTLNTYQGRESSPEDDPDLDKKPIMRRNSCILEEPRKVLLRIYGQVHGERAMDAIVTESVIFTLLSERNLGPKLYGVFSGGRIEEYIPARPLLTKELADPAISMKIAEKMAAIHTMAVPLSNDPDWLWKTSFKWLKTVRTERFSQDVKGMSEKEQCILKCMKTIDFEKELEWLKKLVATVQSPVVFCHNDMQEGNILIFDCSSPTCQMESDLYPTIMTCYEDANTSDSVASRISDSGEPRMMLIDYEYCAYNYRGFDLANHFQEWAYDYSNPEHPFYFEMLDNFPTLEQKEIFIKEYLKHYNPTVAPTVDDINKLLAEVEVFELCSHLLWTLWSCVNACKSKIPFGYWEYAQSRFEMYQRLKQAIIKKENGCTQKRKICEVDI